VIHAVDQVIAVDGALDGLGVGGILLLHEPGSFGVAGEEEKKWEQNQCSCLHVDAIPLSGLTAR
jgi:hypothetical protein